MNNMGIITTNSNNNRPVTICGIDIGIVRHNASFRVKLSSFQYFIVKPLTINPMLGNTLSIMKSIAQVQLSSGCPAKSALVRGKVTAVRYTVKINVNISPMRSRHNSCLAIRHPPRQSFICLTSRSSYCVYLYIQYNHAFFCCQQTARKFYGTANLGFDRIGKAEI